MGSYGSSARSNCRIFLKIPSKSPLIDGQHCARSAGCFFALLAFIFLSIPATKAAVVFASAWESTEKTQNGFGDLFAEGYQRRKDVNASWDLRFELDLSEACDNGWATVRLVTDEVVPKNTTLFCVCDVAGTDCKEELISTSILRWLHDVDNMKMNGSSSSSRSQQINQNTRMEDKPRKKRAIYITCNDDGSDCSCEDEHRVEVSCPSESEEEGSSSSSTTTGSTTTTQKTTTTIKDNICKNERNLSVQYVVCYLQEPDQIFIQKIKPQFRDLFNPPNIAGNKMNHFCNKENVRNANADQLWRGFRVRFTIFRAQNAWMIEAWIDFSFDDRNYTIGSSPFDPSLTYSINISANTNGCLPSISVNGKVILRMEMPGEVAKGQKLQLANGMHAIQPILSDPRIALMHLAKGNTVAMSIFLPKRKCNKQNEQISRMKLEQYNKMKQSEDKFIKAEFKNLDEVLAIVEEVKKVQQRCARPNPEVPPDRMLIPPEAVSNGTVPNDMVLPSLDQAKENLRMAREECNGKRITKRQIPAELFTNYTNMDKFRWNETNYWDPGKFFPIPYQVDYNGIGEWRQRIHDGIDLITDQTCITFTYDPTLVVDDMNMSFIFFVMYPYRGCYVKNLTRLNGANIVFLSISESACPKGAVAHEIMHIMGFEHEQARSDQKQHIWLQKNSVSNPSQYEENNRTKNFGMPYDFGSLMHYPPMGRGGSYAIVAKERAYQQTMGQATGLSFKDAKLLNRLYCNDVCKDNLFCANGGYADPKDCSKCRCPSGYGGKHCDRFYRGEIKCHSGRHHADVTPKYIESSEWNKEAHECFWSIKTHQVEQQIIIVVKTLKNFICDHPCTDDNFLEVQFRADKTGRGARLCCTTPLPYTFTLDPGVEALIHVKRNSSDQQFQLSYETPNSIEEEEPATGFTGRCGCTEVFNPWRKPGKNANRYDKLPYGFYGITIKSEFNLIINGKYRFYTQNGMVLFYRACAIPKEGGTAYGIWRNKQDDPIRITDIVAEPCMTDYDASGCGRFNEEWEQFIGCVNTTEWKEWETKCGNGKGKFTLHRCTGSGGGPPAPEVDGETPL